MAIIDFYINGCRLDFDFDWTSTFKKHNLLKVKVQGQSPISALKFQVDIRQSRPQCQPKNSKDGIVLSTSTYAASLAICRPQNMPNRKCRKHLKNFHRMIFCLYKIFYCDKSIRFLKGNCLKVEERCIKQEQKGEPCGFKNFKIRFYSESDYK